MCSQKEMFTVCSGGEIFSCSPGRVSTCVKEKNMSRSESKKMFVCKGTIGWKSVETKCFSAKSKHWDIVCTEERLDFSVCWISPLYSINNLTGRAGIRPLVPQGFPTFWNKVLSFMCSYTDDCPCWWNTGDQLLRFWEYIYHGYESFEIVICTSSQQTRHGVKPSCQAHLHLTGWLDQQSTTVYDYHRSQSFFIWILVT